MKFATSFILSASLCVGLAQTNLSFQNCQIGDTVKVICDHPLLVLGRASLLEIGSNTVTVCTASERFTLEQSQVTLLRLGSQTLAAAVSPVGSPPPPALTNGSPPSLTATQMAGAPPAANIAQTMEDVRASVIDPHKMEAFKEPKWVNGKWELMVDPNSHEGPAKYKKANDYYHNTMQGVMNGSITQEDLVQQAKAILAQCDKYAKERQDDPQYEQKIATLRDFVRRSEAGEKIDFGTPLQ